MDAQGMNEFAPMTNTVDWIDYRAADGTVKRVVIGWREDGYEVSILGRYGSGRHVENYSGTHVMAKFMINEEGGTIIG